MGIGMQVWMWVKAFSYAAMFTLTWVFAPLFDGKVEFSKEKYITRPLIFIIALAVIFMLEMAVEKNARLKQTIHRNQARNFNDFIVVASRI